MGSIPAGGAKERTVLSCPLFLYVLEKRGWLSMAKKR